MPRTTSGVPVGSMVEAALGAEVDSATEVARPADVTVLEAAATVAAGRTPVTHDVPVVAVRDRGREPDRPGPHLA